MSNLNNLNSPEKTASLFFRMQTLVLNGEKCMIHFVPASRFSYASQTHRDARAVRIHRTLRGSQWHFSAGFDWHAVDQWERRSHPLVFSLWPITAVGAAGFGCSWVWLRRRRDGSGINGTGIYLSRSAEFSGFEIFNKMKLTTDTEKHMVLI